MRNSGARVHLLFLKFETYYYKALISISTYIFTGDKLKGIRRKRRDAPRYILSKKTTKLTATTADGIHANAAKFIENVTNKRVSKCLLLGEILKVTEIELSYLCISKVAQSVSWLFTPFINFFGAHHAFDVHEFVSFCFKMVARWQF